MNMKKYLLSFAVLMMGATLLTGCLNDDNDGPKKVDVLVSNGAYVLCTGNMSNAIDGSLTYYNYDGQAASQKVFQAANGRSLGLTPNSAIMYGSKMYVVVTNENTIEVIDPKTQKSIRQINTIEEIGDVEGVNPRCITAADGILYISTYGASKNEYDENWNATTSGNGYVAAIDTTTFTLRNVYTAGSYPEGLCVANNKIYVANSDYSAITKASISVIDITTGVDTPIKNENIRNPQDIVATSDGGMVYFLDFGEYDASWNQVNAGVYAYNGSSVVKIIPNATMWYPIGQFIYTINAPYGAGAVSYQAYNINYSSSLTLPITGIDYPNAIGVDPVSGHVFIGSYNKNPDTGRADYSANGYVQEFTGEGSKVGSSFTCGVGPKAILFHTSVASITY